MDLKETDLLGAAIADHWYYRAKAAAMERLLGRLPPLLAPSVILDVGAGSGFFSRHLLRHSAAREAWCVDPSYSHESDELEAGKLVRYRRGLGPGSALNADLVLMMDVLEHVDDDVGLLGLYSEPAPLGARFLITVPAFQCLWSGHDEFLEHRRRYTLARLERTVRRAGLAIERSAYYFGLVFPLAAATRIGARLLRRPQAAPRSQLRRHGKAVNGLLGALCQAELPLFPFNRLAGLSAFCLAVRR